MLPRDGAAGVLVEAVARAARAVAAALLLLAIPALADLYTTAGYAPDPVPFLALVGILLALGALAWRPSNTMLLVYILFGSLCSYLYALALLGSHPEVQQDALHLLHRPSAMLILAGTASARPLPAAGWAVAGFIAGTASLVAASIQLGLPVVTGIGPVLVLIHYFAAYLILALMRRAQLARLPDFQRLRSETRQLEFERTVEQRAAALVHDTVLNDLAFVINAPAVLDKRAQARLREDFATLSRGDWVDEVSRATVIHPAEAVFRNQLMVIVSDLQWRGLNVEVSGANTPLLVAPQAMEAALGALRACLENVLQHSGSDSAELVLGHTDESATIMVIDAGVGFSPQGVAADRLGLRASVVQRIERAGGSVRLWSEPGQGTSVLMVLPLQRAGVSEATAGA